jgi:hypothetical protein
MNVRITLTAAELREAAMLGVETMIESITSGRRPAWAGHDWTSDIEGRCGERAVAKYLGLRWNPANINTFKDVPDIGSLEVRTRSKDWYELFIRPDDRDDRLYVLVTGAAGVYAIRGCYMGADAKAHREWLQDHGKLGKPAYFIPTERLRDLHASRYDAPAEARRMP